MTTDYVANIQALAANTTFEISCRFAMKKLVDELEGKGVTIPKGQEFSIVDRSGDPENKDTNRVITVEQIAKITDMGFSAIPHIGARRIENGKHLKEIVTRMTAAGATSFLLLAGDPNPPKGDFSTAMELVDTGVFDSPSIKKIFFAAHPYGNPNTTPEETAAALEEKNLYAEENPTKEVCLITQTCFSSKKVIRWLDRIADDDGNALPVRVGIMQGDLKSKFAFARDVFVNGRPPKDQLRGYLKMAWIAAAQGLDGMGGLVKTVPDDFIAKIASHVAKQDPNGEGQIAGLHFFSGARSADLKEALILNHAMANGYIMPNGRNSGFTVQALDR